MKKVFALFLVVVLVCMSTCAIYAADLPDDTEIMPCYENIALIYLGMTFDGTHGDTVGTASRMTGVTLMIGTLTLYEEQGDEWVYMDTATSRSTGQNIAVNIGFTGTPGVRYKVVFDLCAVKNRLYETETLEVIKTCK